MRRVPCHPGCGLSRGHEEQGAGGEEEMQGNEKRGAARRKVWEDCISGYLVVGEVWHYYEGRANDGWDHNHNRNHDRNHD